MLKPSAAEHPKVGATKVSNNSLRACDKLTPQREGRGWLQEALREAADLDRQGQRKLVPSRSHSAHPATKSRENSRATRMGRLGEPGEAGRSGATFLPGGVGQADTST